MITQKEVIDFFKNTKESYSFCVFVFDSQTGERIRGGGGFHECFSAFMALTRILSEGHKAILTDGKGFDFLYDTEIERDSWITYEELLPYSIKFDRRGNKITKVL